LGAKFGLIGYDESTQTFLNERKGLPRQPWAQEPIAADPDAGYAGEVQVDLNQLEPQLACPHRFDNVMPVARAARIPIQQAQVGSCANGHLEDLAAVASVLRGKRVAPGVRLLVQPASWGVYRAALRQGIVDDVLDAGGQILSPGCHLCVGMQGTLPPGDVCITSTTRNFRGRLGSPDAEIYLGSPATVAASALTGVITDPREVLLCK
jgi:3-isopropylmalate/(R)-2-methylmalate dehydratase large subunit